MTVRVDKEIRDEIKRRWESRDEDGATVRSLARDFGCSPGTIQLWKNREDAKEKPRNPSGPPGLSHFEKAVFREMVRLTGYPLKRLFEYLAPVWGALPSQSRIGLDDDQGYTIEPLTNKRCPKILHPRTFLREMKACSLDRFQIERPTQPGTVAVHKARVRWHYKGGESEDGEILVMVERHSGLIYAKACPGEARPKDFKSCFKRFERMLACELFSYFGVTSGANDHIDLSKIGLKVTDDAITPPQNGPIEIPRVFANKHELNKLIKRTLTAINISDRHYYNHNVKTEMTPYKLFVQLFPDIVLDTGSARRLRNRLLLVKKQEYITFHTSLLHQRYQQVADAKKIRSEQS